ncbi:hypothetical protein PSN45_000406 [Yamadazyma tenuis]|uniref:Allantoin permease n=1 Tax=Candida tenuis (strain ATCC 10573 / BCRC 21748 / CBS 615 / JCM 9827 / NBRC 10315 / NRRL Y-1498 / VKM Y-70) TaxID=590646 RepID=G3B890_CANTC|nr:uncharacterized protein CANTEDRAFT_94604 [Yamadazyma tenuis ATCC 10573]EGV61715.1 hypothetical protein CANTEDRAFT_94604 [Yamadazyma tenuis ATCC 10573]WEJ92948.1 hypothetical protein PSN45_000406 [Yamadazyma tenuis]
MKVFSKLRIKTVPKGPHAWYNRDLLPTPTDERTWGIYHFLFFYFTTSLTPSSYTLGSTLVSNGLLWWHGLICAVIGSFFLSIVLVFNSRAPSVYHLGFPTIVRAAAGMYGSYFFIFVRISVATIYFAVQTYFAGSLMDVLMRCIFGYKWVNIENKLSSDSGITSRGLLSFFLIWFFQLPLMFMHPRHQRHLYSVKMITTTTSLFAVFGYCVRKAGGTLGTPESLATDRVYGSDLVWGVISGINSIMGALCPILINTGDVVRYAKRPSDAAWIQSFAVLCSKVLITFLGCGTTSAAKVFLGETYWNPWDLYNGLLDHNWSAGMRTGIFFASLGMIIALVIVNVGTNCLPVGADATGMFPKYVNITRGQFLCWLVCPLLFPWKISSSGASFLAFLGSYSVMLCPIAATMIYDYFIIRRGNYHIPSFYNPDGTGVFWYNKLGVNWRAMAAWVIGCGFTISGVANSVTPGSIGIAAVRIYQLGFLLSFIVAFVAYGTLCFAFPVKNILPDDKDIKSIGFEELAQSDGFLPGESLDSIIEPTVEIIDSETIPESNSIGNEKGNFVTSSKEL